MRFDLANRAPVAVTIDGQQYLVPCMRRKDWVEWAAEIDGQRSDDATSRISPDVAAKLLLIYPVEPVTKYDLGKRARTPAGESWVIRRCFANAATPVPEDVVARFLDDAADAEVETLVRILCCVVDPHELANRLNAQQGQTAGEGGGGDAENPSPSSTNESATSSKTTA